MPCKSIRNYGYRTSDHFTISTTTTLQSRIVLLLSTDTATTTIVMSLLLLLEIYTNTTLPPLCSKTDSGKGLTIYQK